MAQVTPYLCVRGAQEALEFYANVFGAVESYRLEDPGDGRIGHAEFRIGDCRLFISDEYPDFGAVSPDTLGGTALSLHVEVSDCDETLARAEKAGGVVLRKPANQSFGERVAQFSDPFGHRWFLAQHIEDVTPQEMQRRWENETAV